MYQNNISDLPNLNSYNYENIFNVYADENNNYFYNLLQTLVIPDNLPISFFESYTISNEDTWPLISYKTYNTPNLWWVITQVNNIQDPTKPLETGNNIKILKTQYVSLILSQLISQNF